MDFNNPLACVSKLRFTVYNRLFSCKPTIVLFSTDLLSSGSLWVCIVLNPNCTQHEKMQWKALLEKWTHIDVCPPEDPDFRLQQAGHLSQREPVRHPSTNYVLFEI